MSDATDDTPGNVLSALVQSKEFHSLVQRAEAANDADIVDEADSATAAAVLSSPEGTPERHKLPGMVPIGLGRFGTGEWERQTTILQHGILSCLAWQCCLLPGLAITIP
jgi:hypothetical protein